jgi:glucose-6-phosphate 1-dehydrogenase
MPALESPPPLHTYEVGSWGPKEADELIDGGWNDRIPKPADGNARL